MNEITERECKAYVLLVDDEEEFLELLCERLTNRGMCVTTAQSGSEALEIIDQNEFDIIVLDLSMPGMDGIETMKRIKARTPQTETIMLTGHASLQSGIEAMKSGAEDYLEKPLDINVLIQKIHNAQQKKMSLLDKDSQREMRKILKTRGW